MSSKLSVRLILVSFAVASLMAASVAWAEDLARSVPRSGQLISGELMLDSGESIDFSVLDGGMLKVKDTEQDVYYGIVLSLASSIAREELSTPYKAADEVDVTIFEIVVVQDGAESLKEISKQPAWVGDERAVPLKSKGLQRLTVRSIGRSGMTDSELLKHQMGVKEGFFKVGSCCVTCGNVTACGCGVSSSCGSCCTHPCCPGL